MFGNIKRRPADILFSKYLRQKIGHCEVCGNKESIQVSHFYGRRHENTKFSENPNEYVEWKKRKLGEKRYKLLEIAVNTYRKKDDKLIILFLKQEIKKLN